MPVSIEIKGLEKLTKMAERFPVVAEKHINTAITKGLGAIYAKMAPISPVDTSRLREDFHTPHVTRFQGYIGTDLPYARRVHDMYPAGTPYKNPSKNKNAVAGFLQVGADRATPQVNQLFSEALNNITKELAQAI